MAKELVGITKTLRELTDGTAIRVAGEDLDVIVSGVVADSRKAGPGKVFVAVAGEVSDGHDFLDMAVKLGCVAVVVERELPVAVRRELGVVVLDAADGRIALAELTANFYGHPERQLKMIGITGTNGKTTTSYLLESIIIAGGGEPGVIGTVSYRFKGREEDAAFTTPEPDDLYLLMKRMVDSGVNHLIMEVSSHAIVQQRLHGVNFDVVVFTNLSHDHLDFHGDMSSYFEVKRRLFTEHLKADGIAVVMLSDDDARGKEMSWGDRLVSDLRRTERFTSFENDKNHRRGSARKVLFTCGISRGDIHVGASATSLEGIEAEIAGLSGEVVFRSSLVGDFNLLNMVTAISVGHVLGFDEGSIGRGIIETVKVPGRLERVFGDEDNGANGCKVFVDFAHTPEALAGVLRSVRELCFGRLILVFGCGGDRDRSKRPAMGKIAGRMADVVIITTDNSRSELPSSIMKDIERGLQTGEGILLSRGRVEDLLTGGRRGYDVIESRREAISQAIRFASPDDVVLICGKGHETYQIVGNNRYFFDDRLEAGKQLAALIG